MLMTLVRSFIIRTIIAERINKITHCILVHKSTITAPLHVITNRQSIIMQYLILLVITITTLPVMSQPVSPEEAPQPQQGSSQDCFIKGLQSAGV